MIINIVLQVLFPVGFLSLSVSSNISFSLSLQFIVMIFKYCCFNIAVYCYSSFAGVFVATVMIKDKAKRKSKPKTK